MARRCHLVVVLAAIVMAVRLLIASPAFNQTVDEPSHIGGGIAMWESHKNILSSSHPPLARLWATLPLYLGGVHAPEYRGVTTVLKEDKAYELGTRLLFEGPWPYERTLRTARAMMVAFPLLALLYTYLLGRRLLGDIPATLATVLLSTDPTLLGHGCWVTTDGAAVAGFLAGSYHALRWATAPTARSALVAGAVIGLAVGAKFSCIFLLPVAALLGLFLVRPIPRTLAHGLLIFIAAALSLWAAYFFNVGPMGDNTALAGFPQFDRLPGFVKNTPVPMPSFPIGFVRMLGAAKLYALAYLNGQTSTTGWWYFFPELLALKTPTAVVAAFATAAGLLLARLPADWRTSGVTLLGLLIPPVVYVAASVSGGLNLGLRHLLPAIPFFYLLTAWQLARLWHNRGQLLLATVAALSLLETATRHPDYVAFFNLPARSAAPREFYAVDSNLDWGQDVARLATYLQSPSGGGGRPYTLILFGGRQAPLVSHLGLDPSRLEAPPEGLLCISLSRRELDPPERWAWLKGHTPTARIGAGIVVYDLSAPGAPSPPTTRVSRTTYSGRPFTSS